MIGSDQKKNWLVYGKVEHAQDGVVATGDGADVRLNSTGLLKGEEKLSLGLTLGLKY